MAFRAFSRHSLLACACILVAAVAVTMVVNRGNNGGALPAQAEAASSAPLFVPGGDFSSAVFSGASSATPSVAPAAAPSVVSSATPSATPSVAPVTKPVAAVGELRAVWVPFMSLDMSKAADQSAGAFERKFDAIVMGAKEKGMNALIVHVHPFGDALYKSALFPWSHILTGTQGKDPGYDPLAYMVAASHKAGLQLHAWMNPLRVSTVGTPAELAESNPYVRWKADSAMAAWCAEHGGAKYYNPGYAEVRKLVADGVAELAKNYAVDGIQFDDYFYPTQDGAFDKAAYDAYCATAAAGGSPMPLLEWRRANISDLVAQCWRAAKGANAKVQFGIAPQGNVQNCLNMGADVNAWCSARGYVDYICPQLYVNFENPVLPFGAAAQQWRDMTVAPDVKLYLGLAVYKAGSEVDKGTWQKSDNILAQQVTLGRKIKCDGYMFYSWDYMIAAQTRDEVANMIKALG